MHFRISTENFYQGNPIIKLDGKIFGNLTVVKYFGSHKDNWLSYWICKCKCGNETIASYANLTTGRQKSCGCKSSRLLRNKESSSWTGYEDITGEFLGHLRRTAKRRGRRTSSNARIFVECISKTG